MSAKRIYKILAILLGYGLIIGGFIVFGEHLGTNIKILDIIALCLIFTQFVQLALFPFINLGNPVHKEVGMMGIHIAILNLCCTLSLGLIICGIIYEIPFRFQLMGQLVMLFLLLVGRIAAIHAGEKSQQIYIKEQKLQEGKVSLQLAMDDFSDYIATVGQLDSVIVAKLNTIHDSIRFITPSANLEAKMFDSQFIHSVEDLKVLMRNTTLNKDKISDEVEHLARILARRKSINN